MVATDSIQFHYLNTAFAFKDRTPLKRFLLDLFRKEGRRVEHVNFIFCTDPYLADLNQTYLNHKTLTDIITFELSEKGKPVLSDIYISIDRVRENASQFQTTFRHELHRVIFHGALHLCGYKDKKEKEKKEMRRMEEKYLKAWFHGTQFR